MTTNVTPEEENGCFLIFDEKNEILIDTSTPTLTGIELHVICEHFKLSSKAQYVSIGNEEALKLMGEQSAHPFGLPLRKKADSIRGTARYVSQDWHPAEIEILLRKQVLCKNLSKDD